MAVDRTEMPGWVKLLAGSAGIVLAVVALTPQEWAERLTAWRIPLGIVAASLVSAAVWSWFLTRGRPHHISVISADDYARAYRQLVESGRYNVIKIFGYTGETVMADLIRFDDRYQADMEFRFLHRNWLIEAKDERYHNLSARGQGRRPWRKSQAIRTFGVSNWNFPSRREVRYYDHQPGIKGVLFCRKDSGGAETALFTFQHWQLAPSEGGSQFKGTQQWAVCVHARDAGSRMLIRYLESQFEYEWGNGQSTEALLELEQPGSEDETEPSRRGVDEWTAKNFKG